MKILKKYLNKKKEGYQESTHVHLKGLIPGDLIGVKTETFSMWV